MKKWGYWVGAAVLFVGGFCLSWSRLLPIQNTYTFVMGLHWLWNSAALLLGHPAVDRGHPRTCQLIYSAVFLATGAVWVWISMTELCDRMLPMLAVTIPFLLILYAADFWYDRKK